MNHYDLNLGRRVFLLRIVDGPDNELVIHIASGMNSNDKGCKVDENPAVQAILENAIKIEPDYSESWVITFEDYLHYSVMNESYVFTDIEPVVKSGKTIQRIEESSFINYVNEHLIYDVSDAFYDGRPFQHYRIWSENHIVEVASFYEPVVKKYEEQFAVE